MGLSHLNKEPAGQYLQLVLDHIPDALVVLDDQLKIRDLNARARALSSLVLGKTYEKGEDFLSYFGDAEIASLHDCLRQATTSDGGEALAEIESGKGHLIENRIKPLQAPPGQRPTRTCLVFQKIREAGNPANGTATALEIECLNLENLVRYKKQLNLFLASTREGIIILDNAYHIGIINEAGRDIMEKITGHLLQVGDNLLYNLAPHRQEAVRSLTEPVEHGIVVDYEIDYPDGSKTFWLLVHVEPLQDTDGQVVGKVASLRDVTARKEAELALKNSEERFRFLLENMQEGIQVLGFDWKYIFVNEAAVWQGRYPLETLKDHTLMENYPGVEETRVFRVFRECMEERTARVLENEFVFPDGTRRWFELHIQPVPEGLFVLSMDISKRKALELRLNRFYRAGITGVFYWSVDGRILEANDKFLEMTGYTRQDLEQGRINWTKMTPPEYATQDRKSLNDLLVTGTHTLYEKEYIRKDGTRIPVEIGTAALVADGSEGMSLVLDITDRKKAEEEIRRSNERFRLATQASFDIIWDVDLETRELFVSDALEKLLGVPVGPSPDPLEVIAFIHPDDRGRMGQEFRAFLQAPDMNYTGQCRLLKAGGSEAYINVRALVLRRPDGEPYRIVGVTRDITDEKKHELQLQRLNEEVNRRAAQLQASNTELERFAFVASHDLQEPLRMVSSFMALLEKRLEGKLDDSTRQYFHFAMDGAERMKGLIQDLLQYSRAASNKELFAEVDLNGVVQNVLQLLYLAIQESGATVRINCPLPVVLANKTQMTQLFQNLLGNALKYRSDQNPRIEIDCEDLGDSWKFSVRDNGIGIDPKFHEKIFAVFQRLHTKAEYPGTGIGLAICKVIVERHGGNIWVDSTPGGGSTFFFTLNKAVHE
ncbi:PAS domain S-box protein [Paraflavisolibacter sp. H34]|uniref:PAS domain S-box protein n=1 Tax=Huijunlia imazamoxiresistens TaxID=3127457 RepID=UPI00301AAEE0